MMDDTSLSPQLLRQALLELPTVNRLLGGYRATRNVLDRIVKQHQPRKLRILDVGTGVGDYPREFVRWGRERGIDVSVVAIDISQVTIDLARKMFVPRHDAYAERVRFEVADARNLPFSADSFDIATAALFFHHLSDSDAAAVLKQMARVARVGVIVNDVHRCKLAYNGFRIFASLLGFSRIVRHDGAVSVRRAFKRIDLEKIAHAAGLQEYSVKWHWAFRWTLTDVLEA